MAESGNIGRPRTLEELHADIGVLPKGPFDVGSVDLNSEAASEMINQQIEKFVEELAPLFIDLVRHEGLRDSLVFVDSISLAFVSAVNERQFPSFKVSDSIAFKVFLARNEFIGPAEALEQHKMNFSEKIVDFVLRGMEGVMRRG